MKAQHFGEFEHQWNQDLIDPDDGTDWPEIRRLGTCADGPNNKGRYVGIRCTYGHTQQWVRGWRLGRMVSSTKVQRWIDVLRLHIPLSEARRFLERGLHSEPSQQYEQVEIELYAVGDARIPAGRRFPDPRKNVMVLLDVERMGRCDAFLSPRRSVLHMGTIPWEAISKMVLDNQGTPIPLFDTLYLNHSFVGAVSLDKREGAVPLHTRSNLGPGQNLMWLKKDVQAETDSEHGRLICCPNSNCRDYSRHGSAQCWQCYVRFAYQAPVVEGARHDEVHVAIQSPPEVALLSVGEW